MSIPDGPGERLAALGDELIEIHTWLREELAGLRADVERQLDGRGERPRRLKAHCLSFCSALTRHHTGEDGGAFPALAGSFPELAPTIAKLEEDHELISVVQHDLERLLEGMAAEPDAAEVARVLSALDGLTAILESHFAFEERRIVTALNALSAEAGTAESLLGLPAPNGA
ncbi:hemerythrin domain-containing protein [Streptomyces sp. B6B3]|uniref:hemerythrin domain-containing protein n=1 Tax=Streptomyces sp. B6B3 TaxID=3153570 RepID=UPI00325D9F35